MPWHSHPRYRATFKRVVSSLAHNVASFGRPEPLVFLCGGKGSPRREAVAGYLRRHTPALVFYAEDVWEALPSGDKADALQMESELAILADAVVIVVESPGTFTELGAFALHEELRKKLLPILDSRFESESSFINLGPVRTVDRESRFKPALHADFDMVLSVASEIDDRAQRFSRVRRRELTAEGLATDKRAQLVFLVEATRVVQPASADQLHQILVEVAGHFSTKDVKMLVELGVSLGLLRRFAFRPGPGSAEGNLYYAASKVMLRPTGYLPNALRASVAASLQSIPVAARALDQMVEAGG